MYAHRSSYDNEPKTSKFIMHDYMIENGYELDITDNRFHHEIYLSDPRRCDVNKLKTVIRHPIRKRNNYGIYRSKDNTSKRATHGEEWFGIDYNMNLYKGCCHKCIYCDSRSNCYQVEDFDRVRAKKDEIEILNRELKSKKKKKV